MENDNRPCSAAAPGITAHGPGPGERKMAEVQSDETGKVITAVNRHINGA